MFVNSLGMRFFRVPRGTFAMGNAENVEASPVHTVNLSSFLMQETEVTNEQFERFRKRGRRGEFSRGDKEPVGELTRQEVLRFISWLNRREGRTHQLPSEAQWEYAARGGIAGADYPWGDGINARQCLIGEVQAKPVASYKPNGFGLYDMCGNIAEMVHEAPYEYTKGELTDPRLSDAGSSHLVRGLGVGQAFPQVWFRIDQYDDIAQPGTGFRLILVDPKRSPSQLSTGRNGAGERGLDR